MEDSFKNTMQKRYKYLIVICIIMMSIFVIHISNIKTKYTAEITLIAPDFYDVTHDTFLFSTTCEDETRKACDQEVPRVNPNLKIFETFINKGRSNDNWQSFVSNLNTQYSDASFSDILIRTSKSTPHTKVRILYRGASPQISISLLEQFVTHNMLTTQTSYSEKFDQKITFERNLIRSELNQRQETFKRETERKILLLKEAIAKAKALNIKSRSSNENSYLPITPNNLDMLHTQGTNQLTIEINSFERILREYESYTPDTAPLILKLDTLENLEKNKPLYTAAVIDKSAKIVRSNTSEKILLGLIYLFTCLFLQLIVLTSKFELSTQKKL